MWEDTATQTQVHSSRRLVPVIVIVDIHLRSIANY